MEPARFRPSLKNKKIHPEKASLRKTGTSKKFFTFQETELSYISGGTSKAPRTKIYYTSPEKVMNKCF